MEKYLNSDTQTSNNEDLNITNIFDDDKKFDYAQW